jgi:hypothetical protein
MKSAAPLLAGLIGLSCAGAAVADEIGDPVPGHPNLIYADLMQRVVPDLEIGGQGGGSGRRVVRFQHIHGRDAYAEPESQIVLGPIQPMTIPGDPSHIVLLADLGPSDGNVADAVVLALFSVNGRPRLLDVVEVGEDRFVDLRQPRPAMLGRGAPLILVDSAHDNSNESYRWTDMVTIDRGRFRLIGSVSTFGDQACAYKRTQEPSFGVSSAASGHRTVSVRVREQTDLTHADCDAREDIPRAGVRTFQGRYVWDARRGRYVAHDADLDRLAEENRARF